MAWSFVRTVIKYFAFQLKPHGKCSKLEQQKGWHKMKSTERVSLTQFANHLDKQKFGTAFKNMVINDNQPPDNPDELFKTAEEWFDEFIESFKEDDFE